MVINPENGHVKWSLVFDGSRGFEGFIEKRLVPDGFIVVAACMDDSVSELSYAGRKWFSEMGSTEIWSLDSRRSFAFIGVMGRNQVMEQRGTEPRNHASATFVAIVKTDYTK